MVSLFLLQRQNNQKGLIPANGNSPNFILSKTVLSETNITE